MSGAPGAAGTGRAHPLWASVLLFIVPGLWSTNYIIARLADGLIAPHALALGRWALAAALMLPFVWRPLVHDRRLWLPEWKQLLMLGALGMYVCGAWVYIAGRTTTSANLALIYAITPVTIAALSAALLHERLRAPQKLGIAMAFGGALFVIAKGDPASLLHLRLAPGDFWVMAAAAAWTAYSVLLRKWPSVLGPGPRLVAIMAGGLVLLLPAALLEAALSNAPALGLKALGLVLLAALVPGIASYSAYSYLQRELGASRTALMLYLAPVYGALLAWLVLGERPAWYHLAGGALILPSIWLATRR